MKNRLLFALSFLGVLAGIGAAIFFSRTKAPLPPVFAPASDPYVSGIYAEGIVESVQSSGQNINIYPEVSGTVTKIYVQEGEAVKKGAPLLSVDDSVQKATTEQQKSAAEAAHAVVEELKAQPRAETLAIAEAQVVAAETALKSADDQMQKHKAAYENDPRSVSRDALDTAINAVATARANLEIARRQRDLTKAGAWSFDIRNQEKQYHSLHKAYLSSSAVLAKYVLRAPVDAVVLSINTISGNYVSPQGGYDSYTQGMKPVLVLGAPQAKLHVRCYVDEILITRLPPLPKMKAQMTIRGSNSSIPLQFVRVQPLVSPKIQLADQRQERVDVRVLPIIFNFEKPKEMNLYPGELVDVYIGE